MVFILPELYPVQSYFVIGSYPRAVRSFFLKVRNMHPDGITEAVHAAVPEMLDHFLS